jgi:hypothetical protein
MNAVFVAVGGMRQVIVGELSELEAKLLAMRLNRTLDDLEMRRLESQVSRTDGAALT